MAVETAPSRDPFALSEEERSVRDTVRDWAQREVLPGAAQRDEEERYDVGLFHRAGELGITGLPYPERYGGAGLGTFAWSLAAEEVAAADMALGVSLSVHILSQLCIFSSGTDEQKDRYLPQMTAGRELGAFALTEPGAGSDAASLSLSARRDGDAYLLNGTKIWITNAGEAARYIVFGTVDKSLGKNGITAFVVEADTPGFRLGSKERKMGIRGTTGYELVFTDARVPAENRLGEEGQGLKVALGSLGAGRIGIASVCVGLGAQRARARREVRAPAPAVRSGHRRPGDDPGDACRDGGPRRRRAAPDLACRPHARRRAADQHRLEHGEVVCLRRRDGGDDRRRPGLRWRRLLDATTRSSGSCAMRRARRSTRAPTRSIGSSWPRGCSTASATRPDLHP